jgi:hypothetical protein
MMARENAPAAIRQAARESALAVVERLLEVAREWVLDRFTEDEARDFDSYMDRRLRAELGAGDG